VAKMISAADS